MEAKLEYSYKKNYAIKLILNLPRQGDMLGTVIKDGSQSLLQCFLLLNSGEMILGLASARKSINISELYSPYGFCSKLEKNVTVKTVSLARRSYVTAFGFK